MLYATYGVERVTPCSKANMGSKTKNTITRGKAVHSKKGACLFDGHTHELAVCLKTKEDEHHF